MKKVLILAAFIIAYFFSISQADVLTLDNPETLQTPTSSKLYWYIDLIDNTTKTMRIKYRWIDNNDETIKLNDRTGYNTFVCQNIPDNPATLDIDETDTCFTDVFGFEIRAQDVGTKIGVGLRTLIYNKFKSEVLSTGNDGTWDAN